VKISQSLDQAQQAVTSATTALTNAQNAASVAAQPVTPAQIDADNAAIASAQASLANAQQALSEATIVAPVDGVVAQVNISAGKTTTTSASTSGDIVLESANSFEVSGQVSDTQISEVKLNQQALVTPAGQTASLAGKVNQITPMATVTQGVATFPVNVLITQQSPDLYAGASATVQIIVKQATNVLTVPTSSVHSAGSFSFVDVLQSGKSVRKLVTLGASSGIYTEVTSGLQPGDEVIVANRSAALPSASNNFRANRAAGVGGFGGGAGAFVGGGGGGRPGG
jgi:RND family efflux transporter MFP subunit